METHRYFRSYLGDDYYIPIDFQEDFLYYTRKILENKDILDHSELYLGSLEAFNRKFNRYRVSFRRGQIWAKKTESWMGNDEKGSRVRICKVSGSFVFYRKIGRFNISIGESYCLNKFSMLRIFEGTK